MKWQGARGVAGAAVLAGGLSIALAAFAQGQGQGQRTGAQVVPQPPDDVATLVGRLELAKYKDTIKGLTQFGDRRQGTKRNRDALDWIEAQLKSSGCTNTERITYTYPPPNANAGRGGGGG